MHVYVYQPAAHARNKVSNFVRPSVHHTRVLCWNG